MFGYKGLSKIGGTEKIRVSLCCVKKRGETW